MSVGKCSPQFEKFFVPIFKPLVILYQTNYSSTNLLFEILRSCAAKLYQQPFLRNLRKSNFLFARTLFMKMILSSVGFEPAMEKVFFGWSQIFVPIFKPLVILFQKNYSSTNLLFEILRSCADKILFIGTKFLYIFF